MSKGTDTGERTEDATGRSVFSRRRLLATMGASSALLAGCSSDGSDSTDTDTETDTDTDATSTETESPGGSQSPGGTETTPTTVSTDQPEGRREVGDPVEATFDLKPFEQPTDDWDHSPYSSTVSAQDFPIYPTLAPYGVNDGHPDLEFEPHLMEESKLIEDNTVWRVKMAEGFTWHDGMDVTIEDYYNYRRYNELRREKYENERTWAELRLVDDRTVDHVLHSQQHPVAYLGTNHARTQYRRDLFQPFIERMEDASSPRAAYQIHSDFEDVSISPEDWIGNGQWMISDIGENRVIYERYEDYPEPYKSYQNIEKLKVPIRSGESAKNLLLKDEKTDWYNGLPDGFQESQLADRYNMVKKRTTKQYLFRVNHKNKHLARLGVRRAIAYLKRFAPLVESNVGQYVDKYQDGTTEAIGERWMPDYQERAQNYIDYGDGQTPKREAATAALQNEGYTKENGKWTGPDGDPLTVNITAPWWYEEPAQTMVSWLNQFGFTSELDPPGTYWKRWAGFNDWDIIIGFHSRGPNHPSSSFRNSARWATKMTKINDEGDRVAAGNRKLEVEVPTELGATDLSGDTETLYIPDLQDQVADPEASEEDYVEPMKKLTRWWNYWLPDIVSTGGIYAHLEDTEGFEYLDWNGDGQAEARNNYEMVYSLAAGYIRGREQ